MKRLLMVLAAMQTVAVALSVLSAQAAESCIVSDENGRIALIDSTLPGKFDSEVSSVALPVVYAWAIDWSVTEAAEWPAYNSGMFFFVR